MWEYLRDLPPILSYSLAVVAVSAIVIISLKGKVMIHWGKNLIGIGSSPSDNPTKHKPSDCLTNADSSGKKRTCGDCVLIMMSEREKYELKMNKRRDRVLKSQMIFVEQKIMEIENVIIEMISLKLADLYDKDRNLSQESLEIEYKLFYGLFKDSLVSIKNELRRSCKENGFCDLSDHEFATFIKDKTKIMMSILTQNIRNMYPARGTILQGESIVSSIEKEQAQIYSIAFDIYVYSKQVVIETKNEIEKLNVEFGSWIDNFIK